MAAETTSPQLRFQGFPFSRLLGAGARAGRTDTLGTRLKILALFVKNICVRKKKNFLLFNPLTPRVKPWVIQSFLTFDSMDRTLKCDHSLESCLAVLYCGALSGVKRFTKLKNSFTTYFCVKVRLRFLLSRNEQALARSP